MTAKRPTRTARPGEHARVVAVCLLAAASVLAGGAGQVLVQVLCVAASVAVATGVVRVHRCSPRRER
ncbi:hypothetical protein GTQ99_16395 [Kineococcus sp. T13]|uniref:hypothetical protein n=1 Tax=Kineococcus vitellinus TaxID=2696565 RepID=UPI001411B43D|nr:hypothetical protein [Kineococcus vitellinus]NAZ76989.1 hypothetical protein [Kineococcus vitellinus]